MAPEVGFEPTTNRLTADRSTTELLRNVDGPANYSRANVIQVKFEDSNLRSAAGGLAADR